MIAKSVSPLSIPRLQSISTLRTLSRPILDQFSESLHPPLSRVLALTVITFPHWPRCRVKPVVDVWTVVVTVDILENEHDPEGECDHPAGGPQWAGRGPGGDSAGVQEDGALCGQPQGLQGEDCGEGSQSGIYFQYNHLNYFFCRANCLC